MDSGKVIVIEGVCDCIGKTTQIKLLEEKFKNASVEYVTHHFPTKGKPQAEYAEKYLKGAFGQRNKLDPFLINSFFTIDRAVTWKQDLKEKYDSGNIILLDRYTTSSLTYQGALIDDKDERDKFLEYVQNHEYNVLRIQKPDLVIFLKAPYEVVKIFEQKRDLITNKKKDIHESDDEYMKKVYNLSNIIAEKYGWSIIDYMDNGRIKTEEEINEEIINILEEKLHLNLSKTLK